jgi:hypothetical protein
MFSVSFDPLFCLLQLFLASRYKWNVAKCHRVAAAFISRIIFIINIIIIFLSSCCIDTSYIGRKQV